MLLNLVVFAGFIGFAFVMYMIVQPEKGRRVSVFKESKNDVVRDNELSAIKHYFYSAGSDAITFQTADGKSEYGKCLFESNKLLAIECESGKLILKDSLSAVQIHEIEAIKGGL